MVIRRTYIILSKLAIRLLLPVLLFCACQYAGCSYQTATGSGDPSVDTILTIARKVGDTAGPFERLHYLDSALRNKELAPIQQYWVCLLRHNTYFSKLQDYQKAKWYADTMVQLVSQHKLKDLGDKQFTAYKQLADAEYALEEYKSAYENYDIARYIADTVSSFGVKAKYMSSLGMAYFKEEEYRESARMFASAYKLSNAMPPQSLPHFYYYQQEQLSNAALAFARGQMRDSALYFFRKAEEFIKERKIKSDPGTAGRWDEALSVLYGNLATFYKDNDKYDSAVFYYLQCIAFSEPTGHNVQDLRFNKLKLADLYLTQNKVDEAGKLISEVDSAKIPAFEVVRIDDTLEYSLRNAQVKSRYYRTIKKNDEAFYWLDRHYHFLDMKNVRIQKIKLNNIESGVDNIGHERQLQTLAKDSKIHTQRITILILVIIVSIFAIAIIYYNMRLHKLNSQKLRMEKEHIISESRTTQEKLQRQIDVDRANYLALLENTEDCLWSMDKDLNLLAFNKVYVDFIKVVTGKQPKIGSHDELANTEPAFYRQIFAGYQEALKGKIYNSMDDGIKTDGAHHDFAMRFTPVRDAQGKVIGISCSRKDITEYFKLTASLKKNTEQFKNIAWLQSHALRGPLATVMGIAELLSDEDDQEMDPELTRELLKGMKEKLAELDKLVNEIVKLTY